MNLTAMYATQLHVLRTWRGGPRALVKRLLITLVVSAIAFVITAWLLPNIGIDRLLDAVTFVIVMAALNALIRPVVLVFVAPRSLILTAVAVLLLQILVFLAAGNPPGRPHRGPRVRIVGCSSCDHQHGPHGHPGRRYRRFLLWPADPEPAPQSAGAHSDQPGVVIVQIDGLAYLILAGRIRAGSVNTMANWVRDRSHKLSRWEESCRR